MILKEYFKLQLKMANRKITDLGFKPIIGFSLLLVSFIGLSIFLFYKTEFAAYIYVLFALNFVSQWSEVKRNDFLKSCFDTPTYRKLRLIENSIIITPFLLFLGFKQALLPIPILIGFALLMALINFNRTFSYTIPTLFHKKPFEFTVGFRKIFYLFLFAYFLAFMAIFVHNFNLGAFALFLIFLLSLSFYSTLENEYYVWVFNVSPKAFLIEKIKIGMIYSTVLCLPILLSLGIFFPNEIKVLLIVLSVGYSYLVTIILAKYSSYPGEMNLLQGILIGISFLFLPLLLGVIPFFYLQSIKRLNEILE